MNQRIHSWDVLEPVPLSLAGDISGAFIQSGVIDYRAAARFVSRLPFGRNTNVNDPLVVMREHRGTCSTKHALLSRLAAEQHLDATLVLGIYEMNECNTPGVGSILERHKLSSLPEAHCYLRYSGNRIDVTRDPPEAISQFLHEEDITPEQIDYYKARLHRQFLQRWIDETGAAGRDLDQAWRIREECIVALSR
jgi:hypothetical protein